MQETLQRWIESARGITDWKNYPLIDDRTIIDMEEELVDVWQPYDTDNIESTRQVFESAMARDIGDIVPRFVALNFFFRLAYSPPYWEEEVIQPLRHLCKKHLFELVRLSDVARLVDCRTINWEIVNACAVQDWGNGSRRYVIV